MERDFQYYEPIVPSFVSQVPFDVAMNVNRSSLLLGKYFTIPFLDSEGNNAYITRNEGGLCYWTYPHEQKTYYFDIESDIKNIFIMKSTSGDAVFIDYGDKQCFIDNLKSSSTKPNPQNFYHFNIFHSVQISKTALQLFLKDGGLLIFDSVSTAFTTKHSKSIFSTIFSYFPDFTKVSFIKFFKDMYFTAYKNILCCYNSDFGLLYQQQLEDYYIIKDLTFLDENIYVTASVSTKQFSFIRLRFNNSFQIESKTSMSYNITLNNYVKLFPITKDDMLLVSNLYVQIISFNSKIPEFNPVSFSNNLIYGIGQINNEFYAHVSQIGLFKLNYIPTEKPNDFNIHEILAHVLYYGKSSCFINSLPNDPEQFAHIELNLLKSRPYFNIAKIRKLHNIVIDFVKHNMDENYFGYLRLNSILFEFVFNCAEIDAFYLIAKMHNLECFISQITNGFAEQLLMAIRKSQPNCDKIGYSLSLTSLVETGLKTLYFSDNSNIEEYAKLYECKVLLSNSQDFAIDHIQKIVELGGKSQIEEIGIRLKLYPILIELIHVTKEISRYSAYYKVFGQSCIEPVYSILKEKGYKEDTWKLELLDVWKEYAPHTQYSAATNKFGICQEKQDNSIQVGLLCLLIKESDDGSQEYSDSLERLSIFNLE